MIDDLVRAKAHISLKKLANDFAAHYGGVLSFEPVRFKGLRAILRFDDYPLFKAAIAATTQYKACFAEHFHYLPGEFEGYIYLYDAAEYQKIQEKLNEEKNSIESWWQRYHAADEATKRKMSCGEIK